MMTAMMTNSNIIKHQTSSNPPPREQQEERQDNEDFIVHKIPWSHVHEQTIVGTGGFCNVHQVHINYAGLEEKRLALKRLKPSLLDRKNTEHEKKFVSATSDLIIEGQLLSKLQHPNIIALHGVCEGEGVTAFTETTKGHFLVTDLLEDTLKNRLKKLRDQMTTRRRRHFFTLPSRSLTSPSAVSKRIETIAIGVAKGLAYLHHSNIVWRDLKPDNIGFDIYGTPKIFDLGFARELGSISTEEFAGSLRYLAPEVASGTGQHEPAADVYAFGVLLWEISTLEKPFEQYETSPKTFIEEVVYGGYRPSLYRPSLLTVKSASLRNLIGACWNPNPELRPSITDVIETLQNFVIVSNNNDSIAAQNHIQEKCDGTSSKRISIKAVMKILGRPFKHQQRRSKQQQMRRSYVRRRDTCDTDSTYASSRHTANIEY